MKTATIKIDELREVVHEEVQKAIQELLVELDFLTEEDIRDREEALEARKIGKAIKWSEYAAERGLS